MIYFNSIEEMVRHFGSVDMLEDAITDYCTTVASRNPKKLEKILSGSLKMNGILLRDINNFIDGYYYYETTVKKQED
jgi:hypothetical protein